MFGRGMILGAALGALGTGAWGEGPVADLRPQMRPVAPDFVAVTETVVGVTVPKLRPRLRPATAAEVGTEVSRALEGAGASAAMVPVTEVLSTRAIARIRPQLRPGSVSVPGIGEDIAVSLRPAAREPLRVRAQWDFQRNGRAWTRATMAAIEAHGNGLDDFVPSDMADWCPGYAQNSPAERRAFWAGLFSALAYYESTWRPTAVGGGGQWYGLLQVLPSTARLYRCRATTGQGLLSPAENLSCSVRIASRQVQRRGTIRRGMLDWGPFHDARKRAQMAAWTREQSYCQIPASPATSLRPVARPMPDEFAQLLPQAQVSWQRSPSLPTDPSATGSR